MSSIIRMISSKHFTVQQLAEGVYAALHREGGFAVANACIVDLGENSLIFDTMLTPQAGIDLNLAAEAFSDRPVTTVVNSHYHNDHCWGNQVFHIDTDIIASDGTYHLMITRGSESYRRYKDLIADKSHPERSILDDYTPDSLQHADLHLRLSYLQGIQEAVPRLRLRPPNITFNKRLTIHGSHRSVELYAYSGGHTASDTILFLPSERILCSGDLVYTNTHPNLRETDPGKLIEILAQLKVLDPQIVLPGHGSVSTLDSLDQMAAYLQTIETEAGEMLAQGFGVQDIEHRNIPQQYSRWEMPANYYANLRRAYLRLAGDYMDPPGYQSQDLTEIGAPSGQHSIEAITDDAA